MYRKQTTVLALGRRHESRQESSCRSVRIGLSPGNRTPRFALDLAQLYNQPTASPQTPLPRLESTGQIS
jgi:hypothetical protein